MNDGGWNDVNRGTAKNPSSTEKSVSVSTVHETDFTSKTAFLLKCYEIAVKHGFADC